MEYLTYFLITFGVFVAMEGVTWLTHKYIMHGIGWYFHRDHHQPNPNKVFEKNDAFFVFFSIPSIILFYFGVNPTLNYLFFIGLGILCYGIAYFVVHDIIIHQRFSLFKDLKSKYIRGLRKGHKAHHSHTEKEDGESFGMLYVPLKHFKNLE